MRVPEDQLRRVFERLQRSGELGVVVAWLEDQADQLGDVLMNALADTVIANDRDLWFEYSAMQGALRWTRELARWADHYGGRTDRPDKDDPLARARRRLQGRNAV